MTRFEIFSRACRTLMTPSRIGFVCLILVCLSWKLCFPQNCWSISFAFSLGLAPSPFSVLLMSVICATRMSICFCLFSFQERVVRLIGLEPMTPRLSSACSNQLSYSRVDFQERAVARVATSRFRGVDLRSLFDLLLHRKEVIQPQVPLRLPCYDFIPVIDHTLGAFLLCRLDQRFRVQSTPMM